MKKIILCLFFISSLANASSIIGGEDLQKLTKTICSEHSDPDLCIKGFNKVIGYVKSNDDYFYFCQKAKESFTSVDKEQCNKSQELRDFIDKNAN